MLRETVPRPEDKLKRLSPSIWQLIERRGEFFEADAGDIVLEAQQTSEHLLLMLSGITTLLYLREGAFKPTAIYRERGHVLHHAGMHLGIANPFQIAAQVNATRVVLLDRDTVYDLIARDVTFAEYLFKDLSVRFLVALDFLREEREDPLILRLAKRLLTMAYEDGAIELTQSEIAEILAVTRISISKCLKTLEDLGLIERSQRALI
ncbi:MAG: Crp/Fnr family transcriptional regulator, partial [Pseudomonadota bacterium]